MTDYVTIKRSDIEALQRFDDDKEYGLSSHADGDYVKLSHLLAMLDKAPSVEPVCNAEGTWLWLKLMDYCRKHRIAPATQNDLFAIAGEAHKLYTSPPQAEASIAELEKDARRYRWLKEQNADLENDSFVVLGHDCAIEEQWQKYWVGSDLDKAIDKAMEKTNESGV